jgi:DNA-binding MarR family transcriptional regulator
MPTAMLDKIPARTAANAEGPASVGLDQSGVQHLLGYRLALAEAATRRVYQSHVGKPFELRPVEFTMLLLLAANQKVTPKQLALTLGLPPSNLTVLIDRLAQRELLQRERNPSDGRATILRLTPAGSDLAHRARRVSLTMEDGLLTVLSAAERAMLAELLAKLSRASGASMPR